MIVKMKFVTLTGPRDDIDRMVDKYLSGYDIHLENAMSELSQVHDLRPYVQANPYRKLLAKANTWQVRHRSFSGRTAQQFISHLAGQEPT